MAVVNATGGPGLPYDLTNITSGGNILEFVRNVNDLTGQTFMSGMLLAGFVILYTSMRSTGNQDALIASSFIITVLAVFFRALDFIGNGILSAIIIGFIILFVVHMVGERKGG